MGEGPAAARRAAAFELVLLLKYLSNATSSSSLISVSRKKGIKDLPLRTTKLTNASFKSVRSSSAAGTDPP
jgi:hypothetical protein